MTKMMTLESAMENVKKLVALMKSVPSFKIGEPITTMVEDVARAIESGRETDAIAKCGDIFSIGRSILGKFIRNSVIDLRGEDGNVVKEAFFSHELRLRGEEGYDKDILERIQKFKAELEEAVRIETNGDFTRRIAAYNAMHRVLEETWAEQEKRDKVRELQMRHGKKVKSSKRDDTPDAEMTRQAQRAQAIQKRAETAKDFRSIL